MSIFPMSAYNATYLLDQNALGEVPYGKSTVAKHGCGFVAVYNLLQRLGKKPDLDDVYMWFNECVSRGIRMKGTTIFQLWRSFRHFGLKVRRVRICDFKHCDTGIICYATNSGTGHYVTYYNTGVSDYYRFLNSPENMSMPFDTFCEKRIKHLTVKLFGKKVLDIPLFFAIEVTDQSRR